MTDRINSLELLAPAKTAAIGCEAILHDAELDAARKLVHDCYDAGVDALIVQDMGLLELELPPQRGSAKRL